MLRRDYIRRGFTLVETIVAIAIIAMVTVALYQSYALLFKLVNSSKVKTAALELAEERIEIVRNLPYASIGVINGIPVGVLPRTAEYVRAGIVFQATTTVRNIDDPFDGQIGSTTNDTSPADYKLVELEIGCETCPGFEPIAITTTAAPRSLETTSGNGALFVSAIDANGDPVAGADVTITGQGTSTVSISDTTNADGVLQIVDIPPGSFLYRVAVAKAGYSSERTYASNAFAPSAPTNADSTVSAGLVTQISFAIDEVSSVNVRSVTDTCAAVPSIDFTLSGAKTVATAPDVLKNSITSNTGMTGSTVISDMEWDSYELSLGGGKLIAGSIPLLPLALSPGTSQDLYVIPADDDPNSLLVTVRDASTGLQLSGATVKATLGAFSETKVTNRGFFSQTDWSGGDGQDIVGASDRFFGTDGNIEYNASPGEASLKDLFGSYPASGELVSSWFDFGQSTTTLYSITWLPTGQPVATGPDSVRFQVETTDDTSTAPGVFYGPDGTPATYYTLADTNIHPSHSNQRYVRYKMYLSTADSAATPLVSDVYLSFGTECVPFGQVYFKGLASGTYDLDVSAAGYTPVTGLSVPVTSPYQSTSVSLSPI